MSSVNRLAVVVGTGLALVASAASAQVAHQVVADLSTIGASQPMGGLVRGPDGALYGTTWTDVGPGCGTVYRFEEPGTLSLVHQFELPDGCNPIGDLALAPDGALYGVTYSGGVHSAGTVFRIVPGQLLETIHSFDPAVAATPYAGLTLGVDGRLFGTTIGPASVYAITTAGAFTTLTNAVLNPQAGLVRAPSGVMYGVDKGGGSSVGSVFQLSTSGAVDGLVNLPFVPLSNPLVAPYGAEPLGELVVGPNGSLFGTARLSGPNAGSGTIFRLCNPSVPSAPCYVPSGGSWTIELLHEFPAPVDGNLPTGGSPWPGMILAADGAIYGTTIAGGANNNGTMFRVTPAGAFELLHSFGGVTGGVSPEARLFETSAGVFYALTSGHIHRLALTTSRPPVAEAVSTKTDEDAPVSGVLVATDPDGDPLTFSLASNGSLGTATIVDVATGAFSYVPNRDANGIDTFTFRVSDGTFESDVATVTVIVWPVNDAPVASGLAVVGDEDTPATFTLPGSDVDSTALTYAIVANGSRGTAVVTNPATGAVTYTPAPSAFGTDTLTYQVSDGSLASSVGVVTVTVAGANDAPFAHATSALALKDTPLPITVTGADSESIALNFTLVTAPSHGTLSGALPSVTYTPAPGYLGLDSFTFVASDGSAPSAAATVGITVVDRLWKRKGPDGGQVTTIVGDPRDPSVVYAGVANAGLIRSVDAGATWQALGSGFAGAAADGIAVGADPTRLAAVGSAGRLLRSVNGGGAWTFATSLPNARGLVRQPLASGHLYAPAPGQVFRSVDDGATWMSSSSGLPASRELITLAVDPLSSATLYVGSFGAGVFRSQDSGSTWVNILPFGVVRGLAVDSVSSQVIYAATDSGLRKTIDGGATWTLLSGIPPAGNTAVAAVAVDPDDPSTVLAGTRHDSGGAGGGLYRSTNGGAAWTLVAQLPVNVNITALLAQPGSPAVFAGTDSLGIMRSLDGGTSWSPVATGTGPHTTGIGVSPSTGSVVYAGTVAGVFRSGSAAESWSPVRTGLSTYSWISLAVHPTDPDIAYAGSSRVYRTVDGGTTWSDVSGTSGANVSAFAIDPLTPAIVYAGLSNGVIKSSNGGATWNRVLASNDVAALAIDPSTPAIVYAATATNGVMKSVDGGGTWNSASSGLPPGAQVMSLAIDPQNPQRLYVFLNEFGRRAYRTVDGGASWTQIGQTMLPNSVTDLVVDPRNGQHLYAAANAQGVYQSRDGGVTWAPAGAGWPMNVSVRRLALAATGQLFAATLDGVYRLDTPPNGTPVASAVAASGPEDAPLPVSLLGSDPDGQPLTFSVTSQPSRGTLSGTAPDLVYSPAANYSGPDSFTFRVNDGIADSNDATVAISITAVNDAPVASPGSLSTVEDTPASGQLLASDIDSASLTFAIATAPSLGSVALDAATGAYTYTPNPNASGLDTFSFQASDGQATSSAAGVEVTISPASDATQIAATSSPNPSIFGQLVTLEAVVTSAGGTPSGYVQFHSTLSGSLGAGLIDAEGRARMVTASLRPGDQVVTAEYLPTSEFDNSLVTFQHVVTGSARFTTLAPALASQLPTAVVTADFNGDGRPDVATAGSGAVISVLLAQPDGSLVESIQVSTLPVSDLETADLNGDGKADLVVASYLYRELAVLLGVGDGTFSPAGSIPISEPAASVVVADIDGNGRPDVVASVAETVAVATGNGDGTFEPAAVYPTADTSGRIAIGDLDADGRKDLAYTTRTQSVRVLAGDGAAGFVSGPTIALAERGFDLMLRDFDDDGRLDLAVASQSPTQNFGIVQVVMQASDGSFATPLQLGAGSGIVELDVLDADGDSVPDIAVASIGSRTISILRGLGGGLFEPAVAFDAGPDPSGLRAVDLNLDGATDLVASNASIAAVVVLLNSGGTNVTVSATPAAPTSGEAVTLNATVTATVSALAPSGQVTFVDGPTVLGTAPLSGSIASLPLTGLTPGAHAIAARYEGDTTFNPRVSAPIGVTVAAAPLTVTVVAPNGGERVFANVPVTVRWVAGGTPTAIDVELSRNGGSTFTPVSACVGLPAVATSCVWTPAAPAGTALRVRVIARDASGSISDVSDADFTLSTAVPTVTVTAPNSAVSWRIGTVQNLRWNHNLGLGSPVRVELSRDGGATWETLAATFPNTAATSSTLPWIVSAPATTSALLRVTWLEGSATSDVSNVPFAIVRPTITVTAPNTAVTWSIGSSRAITWTHNLPAGDTVDLDVSRDGGSTWTTIATGLASATPTAGNYNWGVSGPESTTARIRARWSADALANDASNVDFSVVAPVVTLTAPNTAVTWRVGSSQTLRATHNLGAGQPVAFDISADDGATWTEVIQVTTGTSNAVTYPWMVALPTSNSARIRARWVTSPVVADASDVPFRIIPRITVTAPNTALTWGAGSTRTVTWTHNLGTSEPVDIAFSANGGATWTTIATGVANATATTGSTAVALPVTPTTSGLVRVNQTSAPAHFDVSDVFITVAPPAVTVTAPNTNVNWTIGSARNITWSHNLGTAATIQVELSRDGGATWTSLGSTVANTGNTSGSFPWTVTGPATTAARVRVTWTANPLVQDVSNVSFRIQ